MQKKIKCVILAGGVGSRLFEETKIKPKPLVEINSEPIILHIIKYIKKFGINEFFVCLGYKGNLIQQYFEKYAFKKKIKFIKKKNEITFLNKILKNVKIHFAKTGIKTGTGGRVLKLKDKFNKNENFLLVYGDGLYNVKINKLINQHIKNNKTVTMTITRPKNRFGLAHCVGDNLTNFNEKKTTDKSNNWINAGVFVVNDDIFKYINNSSIFFEHEPIQKLIKKKQIKVFKHNGFWACMDTLKDKIELNKIYKSKPIWAIN
jgi:glucose-1-phosphate cytidylyltransferase